VAFDNVLTGDYQVVEHANRAANGAPMVHIRARREADFPRTFYTRLSQGRDARQPLPTTFAALWSTRDGTTLYDIWREAPAGRRACADYDNAFRTYAGIVRFDESENSVSFITHPNHELPPYRQDLPSTSRTNVFDASIYPQLTNGATSGWMYFDLGDPGEKFTVQAWISMSRIVPGRSSERGDVTALGNGCSPPVPNARSDR